MREAVTRPDDYQPYEGDPEALAERGEELFYDNSLSTNNFACVTCHADVGGYADTFAEPYPHRVAMAHSDFGIDKIHLDEMVQVSGVRQLGA